MSNNRPNVLLEFREDNKQLFITNMKNMESKYSQSRKFNYNTVDIFKCGIGCVRSNILSIKDRQGNKFIVKLLTLHEYEITEYIFDNLKGLCKSYVVSSSVMYVPPPVADKYTGSEFYMYLLIMPFYENTPGVKDARKRWSLPSRRSAASELLNFKKKLLFRMAVGIECLHAAGVSHSDIKDENFFGDDVLIGDFGLSSTFVDKELAKDHDPLIGDRRIGLETVPPELYGGEYNATSSSRSTDIWGYGIVMLQYLVPDTTNVNILNAHGQIKIKLPVTTRPALFGKDGQPRHITPLDLVINLTQFPMSDLATLVTKSTNDSTILPFLQVVLGTPNTRNKLTMREILFSKQGLAFFNSISDGLYYREAMEYLRTKEGENIIGNITSNIEKELRRSTFALENAKKVVVDIQNQIDTRRNDSGLIKLFVNIQKAEAKVKTEQYARTIAEKKLEAVSQGNVLTPRARQGGAPVVGTAVVHGPRRVGVDHRPPSPVRAVSRVGRINVRTVTPETVQERAAHQAQIDIDNETRRQRVADRAAIARAAENEREARSIAAAAQAARARNVAGGRVPGGGAPKPRRN